MNGKPVLNRVLIRRIKFSEKTKTTLIIPKAADVKYASDEGIILQCGPTVIDEVKAHEGKKVIFAKYAGAWIKINDAEHFICNDEDILYLVEE